MRPFLTPRCAFQRDRERVLRNIGWVVLLSMVAGTALAAGGTQDWRKTGSANKKLEKLVEALPVASNIMIEMGERYKNLYWAAKLEKWEFAEYQAEEMEELIVKLKVTHPELRRTADEFLGGVYPRLPKAIKTRNWEKFTVAFEEMRTECMACHGKNEHGFITLPIPKKASSPVLDME